jgi:queuine/archaeosine tRNA-ribosyltransferase
MMRNLRKAILEGKLADFVKDFMKNWFNGIENVPKWVKDALDAAEVIIE